MMSFLNVTETVLIPAFSNSLAINPTDWLQITHVGVRKAISISRFLRRLPTSLEFSRRGPVT